MDDDKQSLQINYINADELKIIIKPQLKNN